MCASPHEMSTASIESYVKYFKEMLEEGKLSRSESQIIEGRMDNFTDVLKERAEEGTLLDDHDNPYEGAV